MAFGRSPLFLSLSLIPLSERDGTLAKCEYWHIALVRRLLLLSIMMRGCGDGSALLSQCLLWWSVAEACRLYYRYHVHQEKKGGPGRGHYKNRTVRDM
ncbi:hypothetical protein LZ30DRAFT_64589 [Colletotrichum cereale]|nr:hypothetical protein LZ30DRAFT_64589 [Colletotrichum cereale]